MNDCFTLHSMLNLDPSYLRYKLYLKTRHLGYMEIMPILPSAIVKKSRLIGAT